MTASSDKASPGTGPAARDDGGRVALAVALLVAATVLLGALLPARPGRVASPADDPACAEWSDGCSVCRRLPDGPACSLPGIACTPGKPQCLHRAAG